MSLFPEPNDLRHPLLIHNQSLPAEQDSERPLAFTILLTPTKIQELRDLMYDENNEGLDPVCISVHAIQSGRECCV
jgi:hypothetical protein